MLEDATRLFREANLHPCLQVIESANSPAAAILRARVFQRLRETQRGLDALATVDELSLAELQLGEFMIVKGYLLIMSGRLDEAHTTLNRAKQLVLNAASAAAEAEYHVVRSIYFYASGDFLAAARSADEALHVDLELMSRSLEYFESTATLRIRALQLQGIILASEELYHEQGRVVRKAVTIAQADAPFDLWPFAHMLCDLAFYVRDFHSSRDAETLRKEIGLAKWPTDLSYFRFEIYRSLAEFHRVSGDTATAAHYFEQSMVSATTPVRLAIASASLAEFMAETGKNDIAQNYALQAINTALDLDWTAQTSERNAALQISSVVAVFFPEKAQELLASFKRSLSPSAAVSVAETDRRVRAYLLRAEAMVFLAFSDKQEALKPLREAFEIWNEIGFEWLAATMAIKIYELSRERRFSVYLNREIGIRPNSPLAAEFKRLLDNEL